MSSLSPKIAVYWDFENLHASLFEQHTNEQYNPFQIQRERMLNVSSLMDYLYSLGDVVINRAYNDWQWYRVYKSELLFHAIDLVQLYPKGAHAKNGADIRLAMDALEDAYQHVHISHAVIIGGDSDYIAVAQKLKKLGKFVIGIGVQATTNPFWTRSCNEFKYYETITRAALAAPEPAALVSPPEAQPHQAATATAGSDFAGARELLVKAIQRLMAEDDVDAVLKAKVRPMMTRLDPGFDPANYSFQTFNSFLAACDDVIRSFKGEYDTMLALKNPADLHGRSGEAGAPRPEPWAAYHPANPEPQAPTNVALEHFLWCVHTSAFQEGHSVTLSDIGMTLKVLSPDFSIQSSGYPKNNGLKALADHAAALGLITLSYDQGTNVHSVTPTDAFAQRLATLVPPTNLSTVRCIRIMSRLFLLIRPDEVERVLRETRGLFEGLRGAGEDVSLARLIDTATGAWATAGMKKRTGHITGHLIRMGCYLDAAGQPLDLGSDRPLARVAEPDDLAELYVAYAAEQLRQLTAESYAHESIAAILASLPVFSRPQP